MSSQDALDLGPGLPGWVLRVVIGLVAGVMVAVLVDGGIGGVALILLVFGGAISVLMPASPAPALVIVLVAMSLVAIGGDAFRLEVLVLVPLVHALHVLCGVAGLLPARSRVHLGAFKAPAIRFVAVQAGVFGLAGVLAVLPAGRGVAALELLAILGVAAIAPIVLWLLAHRPQ
jgi:hypothetical protein